MEEERRQEEEEKEERHRRGRRKRSKATRMRIEEISNGSRTRESETGHV